MEFQYNNAISLLHVESARGLAHSRTLRAFNAPPKCASASWTAPKVFGALDVLTCPDNNVSPQVVIDATISTFTVVNAIINDIYPPKTGFYLD